MPVKLITENPDWHKPLLADERVKNVPPFAVPQIPLTGVNAKVADTEQLFVI